METIIEHTSKKELRYFMFDWDDNILVMPTMIHLERLVDNSWEKMDITTSEFTEVRSQLDEYYNENNEKAEWRFYNNERSDAFCEFRDGGIRGKKAFLQDVKKSIQYGKFGPVWDEFIKCVIDGNMFLIITARGHEPETIKSTVKWIVYKVLTEDQRNEMVKNLKSWTQLFGINDEGWDDDDHITAYLNLCNFIGISSDWFVDHFKVVGKIAQPEKYKAFAIKYFVQKISKFGKMLNKRTVVGFSDDDLATVKSIKKFFKNELSLDFPMDFHSYHTMNDGTKTEL